VLLTDTHTYSKFDFSRGCYIKKSGRNRVSIYLCLCHVNILIFKIRGLWWWFQPDCPPPHLPNWKCKSWNWIQDLSRNLSSSNNFVTKDPWNIRYVALSSRRAIIIQLNFLGQTAASRCEGFPSHLEAVVYPRKCHWILSLRSFQDDYHPFCSPEARYWLSVLRRRLLGVNSFDTMAN